MCWFPHSSRQTRSTPQNRRLRFGGERLGSRFRRTAGVWALILCCTRLGPAAAAEPAAAAAENFLRHVKDVSNIPGGKVWLCGAERTLRSCLASLGDSRRELVQQQRFLDQRIQQTAQAWEANRQQIAALKSALSGTATEAPERKKIEQQIRRLESQTVDPDQLAAQSDVRAHLIQFTNARNALAVKLLAIRRSMPADGSGLSRSGGGLGSPRGLADPRRRASLGTARKITSRIFAVWTSTNGWFSRPGFRSTCRAAGSGPGEFSTKRRRSPSVGMPKAARRS